jgi:uncharacterized integral membrane protein
MIYLAILTFVFVIFAFCFLYFWGINPGDMTVFYAAGEGLTFPAPIIIIGAILIGLLLGNGLHILSLIAHSFSHWRRDHSQKKAQETNAIYREGVGRLLSGDLKKARTLLKKAIGQLHGEPWPVAKSRGSGPEKPRGSFQDGSYPGRDRP